MQSNWFAWRRYQGALLASIHNYTHSTHAHTNKKRLKFYAQTLSTYWAIIIVDDDDDNDDKDGNGDNGGEDDGDGNDVASMAEVKTTPNTPYTPESMDSDGHMHQVDKIRNWTLMQFDAYASNRNAQLFWARTRVDVTSQSTAILHQYTYIYE